MINAEIARTLAVLREMAQGKVLVVDRHEYHMDEEMNLFVYGVKVDIKTHIHTEIPMVCDWSLGGFNAFLSKHEIGPVIP